MNYGKRIKAARETQQMTQEKLADTLGISRQTVIDWEAGRHLPPPRKRAVLARALRVSPLELFASLPVLVEKEKRAKPAHTWSGVLRIPLLGAVPAGPVAQVDTDLSETIPAADEEARCYALRVQGNSMQPRLNPGDIIIVRPVGPNNEGVVLPVNESGHPAPVPFDYVRPYHGRDMVVTLNGESTVKRLECRSTTEGYVVSLVPANVKYKPYNVRAADELRIHGAVVGVRYQSNV